MVDFFQFLAVVHHQRAADATDAPKVRYVGRHFVERSRTAYDFQLVNTSKQKLLYGEAGSVLYRVEFRANPQAAWEQQDAKFGYCGNAIQIKALRRGAHSRTFSVEPAREGWQEFRVCVRYIFDRVGAESAQEAYSAPVHRP